MDDRWFRLFRIGDRGRYLASFQMVNSLRILLFVLVAFWAAFSMANLQLRPIPGYHYGGLYQFTTENSRGWPRSDALTQRIHSVQSESSVFGALKYDKTVVNTWRVDSLVVNTILSILLLTTIIYSIWKIIFSTAQLRIPISSALICIAAVAVTLAVFMHEQEIYQFAFQTHSPLLPDFYARTLGDLSWNDRAFVVVGVLFLTFLVARYIAKYISKLFLWFSPKSTLS